MRRPLLAVGLMSLVAVAILILASMGGAGAQPHDHLAASPTDAPAPAATSPSGSPSTDWTTSVAADHADHDAATAVAPATAVASDASPSTAPSTSTETSAKASDATGGARPAPEGDPAGLRQIGLAEAAGAAPGAILVDTASGNPASPWVDADAAGVDDGSKKQAASVQLSPAPSVAPSAILPAIGQVNGCVVGYGRGVVCLPQTPPSHAGHAALSNEDLSRYWTCAEVRTLLPDGVVLDNPASDPLGLDGNADGQACGPGDQ